MFKVYYFRKWYEKSTSTESADDKVFAFVVDAVAIDSATLFKWSHSPPSKPVIDKCASITRLLNLRSSGAEVKHSNNLSDVEWKNLTRCKRLYAACLLDAVICGQSSDAICLTHNIEGKVLDDLFSKTKTLSSKLKRFCGEVGWIALEKMVSDFLPNIEVAVPSEIKELMCLPTMNTRAARVLYEAGIRSISDLADSAPKDIAHRLQLGLAYEIDVRSFDIINFIVIVLRTLKPVTSSDGPNL